MANQKIPPNTDLKAQIKAQKQDLKFIEERAHKKLQIAIDSRGKEKEVIRFAVLDFLTEVFLLFGPCGLVEEEGGAE